MNTLILLLASVLVYPALEHSILITQAPIKIVASTDYSPAIIWYAALTSLEKENTPTPPNQVKVGDKCPECKGTGWISTDGTVAPFKCHHCKGDGIVNEGDPILTGVYSIPSQGNSRPNCEWHPPLKPKAEPTKPKLPIINKTVSEIISQPEHIKKQPKAIAPPGDHSHEALQKLVNQAIQDWLDQNANKEYFPPQKKPIKKPEVTKVVPVKPKSETTPTPPQDIVTVSSTAPVNLPKINALGRTKVWAFWYNGVEYYYYPLYNKFASTSGKTYTISTPPETWQKEGTIYICHYNEYGEKTSCSDIMVYEREIDPALLTYRPNWPLQMTKARMGYYPTGTRSAWIHNGGQVEWPHLLEGIHTKHHFDPNWLMSLSPHELGVLHGDSHRGNVLTDYIMTTE